MFDSFGKKQSAHLQEQVRLLKKAESSGEPLVDVLLCAGWSYENLVYETSRVKSWSRGPTLTLEDLKSVNHQVPVVSFFAGCGGMDLGMEAAGFRHVAAFEINELFCKTLRRNRPHWNVFGPPVHSGDVSCFDEVAKTLGSLVIKPFDGLFIGGPPCQPFSIAANQRFAKSGGNFKRVGFSHEKNGNLLFDYLRLIIEFRPKVFVIENVPGLRDIDDGVQLQTATKELQSNGYNVLPPLLLNAAYYGVPQQRLRLFIIGSRVGGAFRPMTPHAQTVGAGSVLNGYNPKLPNNETRAHKAESILRYMRLSYGQRDQLGRVDRLDPTLPSKTVIAGGTKGGGRSHLHPEVPRTLSVRECARLQTFPDDYVFMGPSARQFTQVGNAVPPVLAAQLGKCLIESYF
jgi:DNA (cytosine-5)-methyltransferase 1